MNHRIKIIQTGYSRLLDFKHLKADGTITLVTGPISLIVDTGLPQDKDLIIKSLYAENLTPEEIKWVICTHGHSDHIGNNNLFPQADFIVGFDYGSNDLYTLHDFASGAPLELGEGLTVIPTPGHSGQDVSVLVKSDNLLWAITGDLFESEQDLTEENLWKNQSMFPELQKQSRAHILQLADRIIPGHGAAFRVK